jgi:hypothetical protein
MRNERSKEGNVLPAHPSQRTKSSAGDNAMKAAKKGRTVRIEMSEEEACMLVACLGGTRNAEMIELQERLLGSPVWKFKHRPHEAHQGVLDPALYAEVVERCD